MLFAFKLFSGRDRLAHVLSRQHLTWTKRCQNAIERVSTAGDGIHKSEFHLQEFKNYCLGESAIMSRILQDSNSNNDLHQSEYESDNIEGKNKVPLKDSCNFCNKDIIRSCMKDHLKSIHKIKPDHENNPEVPEQTKQLDYTRCVCCEFIPTYGSIWQNKDQMISHYIVNHFREKCYNFLKINKIFVPPYTCHIEECHFSSRRASKYDLIRHYAKNHEILERFYEETISEPEPESQHTVL